LRGVAGAQAAPAGVAGAWKLHSFDIVEPGKPVTPRFGADPVGYLIYTPDGHVSATLSGIKRPTFSSKAIVPEAECQGQMLADFLCYAGTYDVKGDRVFHHVEVSVFTDLVGQTLEREFKIDGDTLTIRTITGGMWGTNSILVWKRG
jgi:hypothetical protein